MNFNGLSLFCTLAVPAVLLAVATQRVALGVQAKCNKKEQKALIGTKYVRVCMALEHMELLSI